MFAIQETLGSMTLRFEAETLDGVMALAKRDREAVAQAVAAEVGQPDLADRGPATRGQQVAKSLVRGVGDVGQRGIVVGGTDATICELRRTLAAAIDRECEAAAAEEREACAARCDGMQLSAAENLRLLDVTTAPYDVERGRSIGFANAASVIRARGN